MQILYGTAMTAIFMLCLVLLWTARRILRSSPLTSGQLSLSPVYASAAQDDSFMETDYAEIAQFDLEPEVAEISTSLLDPLALEMMASASSVATETMTAPIAIQIEEPMQAAMESSEPPQTEALFEAADAAPDAETERNGRFTKHFPHSYNYMLEGLLLGISVFVLIRTQRKSWRYQHRALQSSDQVA